VIIVRESLTHRFNLPTFRNCGGLRLVGDKCKIENSPDLEAVAGIIRDLKKKHEKYVAAVSFYCTTRICRKLHIRFDMTDFVELLMLSEACPSPRSPFPR